MKLLVSYSPLGFWVMRSSRFLSFTWLYLEFGVHPLTLRPCAKQNFYHSCLFTLLLSSPCEIVLYFLKRLPFTNEELVCVFVFFPFRPNFMLQQLIAENIQSEVVLQSNIPSKPEDDICFQFTEPSCHPQSYHLPHANNNQIASSRL